VAGFFVSAVVVGEARGTAAKSAGVPERSVPIGKLKEDIARRKRESRLIEKLKTGGGFDRARKTKQYWMMQLLHCHAVALKYR
jgi:hypothetical protein